MPTYYFDSVAGSDSNNGLSPSQPLKGVSPAITTYYGAGNILKIKRGSVYTSVSGGGMQVLDATSVSGMTIEDYGDGALPVFDARITIPTANWTHNGSGIWRREWTYIRQVQRVYVGSQDIELLESSHKNGGVSGIDGSQTFWYWALDDPSPGSSRLYMWSGSTTLSPTQVWGSVKFSDFGTNGYSTRIMRLLNCSDIVVRNICLRGPTTSHIDIQGGNNFLLDGVQFDMPPLYRPSLIVQAGAADANNVEVKNCRFTTSGIYRNIYSNAGASTTNDPNTDPAKSSPYRDNGGNDTILLRCPSNVTIRNTYLEAGYHGGVTFYPHSITSRAGDINLTMSGCEIVCGTLGPYSRGIGLQRSASGGSGTVVIENNKFVGQLINSQIAGAKSVVVRNNVFGPCGYGISGNMPDYYNTGRTYDFTGNFRHLSFQTYSGASTYDGGAASIVVESNQFQGAANSPLNAEWYDGEPASNVIVIRNNHIANVGEPWGDGSNQRIFERRTSGSWTPVIENNTYEGALNAVVGLWDGATYVDSGINNYGGGNTQQSKTLVRPIITPR